MMRFVYGDGEPVEWESDLDQVEWSDPPRFVRGNPGDVIEPGTI